ncbi:PEPxxWA-CTERM sorting domain-containing protein [Sphingomonas sp. XMGL2]|uniref:PEPxxWA-CTERM sorting domain-containing protein n=2 Tax=Sphingomonas quercus TaxID=2842451 RepID=A0ABS6BHR9_9SPHN|nr:PEPxxWA-CTERM sorting domain-containing protein [Sphingomonas quercus]
MALAAIATAAAAPASATIILVDASSIQGDNVLFNVGTQTGTTVNGFTQGGTTVAFTGSTVGGGNIIRASGGQAQVEGALNGATPNPNDTLALSGLNFSLVGGNTFNDLEFNVFGGGATSATFVLTDDEGVVFNFVQALGNGSNFFGFQGIDGQTIASVSLSFNGTGVGDVRQIRLRESAPAGAVPEPASWAMMLMGFGLAGYGLRNRRRTATVLA